MASKISEKTVVPLSLAFMLFAGVYKFAQVSLATEVQQKDIGAISAQVKDIQTSVMVDLKDQSANIVELKQQVLILDSKLNLISESLKSIHSNKLRQRGD